MQCPGTPRGNRGQWAAAAGFGPGRLWPGRTLALAGPGPWPGPGPMAGLAHGPFVWPWPPLGTNWARPWARARLFGPLSGPIDRPEARAGPWAQAQIGWAWPRAQQFFEFGPFGPRALGAWALAPFFWRLGPGPCRDGPFIWPWPLYLALYLGPGPWGDLYGGSLGPYWALFLFNIVWACSSGWARSAGLSLP